MEEHWTSTDGCCFLFFSLQSTLSHRVMDILRRFWKMLKIDVVLLIQASDRKTFLRVLLKDVDNVLCIANKIARTVKVLH